MIRLAELGDLEDILEIYRIAKIFMEQSGNPTQWSPSYPSQDLLQQDILEKQLYVYIQDNNIHGVFAFIIGQDPTYINIENGSWINDSPYGTIHRIASDGKVKGIFYKCLNFCKEHIDNIRIDTHENNTVMQHLFIKNGFKKCGTIYLQDGSPRIAYQYVKQT